MFDRGIVSEESLVLTPQGDETYILCRSPARWGKELAIRSRFSGRMEKALAKRIAAGKLKGRHKIERRLGSIQARPPGGGPL